MIEAVLFWGFAIYGALVLVWQSVRSIQRAKPHPCPLSIILVVQNAELQIEGLLRSLMVQTAFYRRERRIVVVDVASEDETGHIVQCLANRHTCIEYVLVPEEPLLIYTLKDLCLNQQQMPTLGCIYDLRGRDFARTAPGDIASLYD